MASPRKSAFRVVLLLLLVFIPLGWAGNAFFQNNARDDGPPLQTARADRGDIEKTISAAGQLHPVFNVQVGSQVSGIVQEILVDFNSLVREGQVLARLDPSMFKANVRQAEGELANAQAALELARVKANRARHLYEQALISSADMDEVAASLRQAEAAVAIRTHTLERASLELARCTIYSPTDGIVISRNIDVGQTVAASLSAPVLFVIANDLAKMQINANISEADIGRIDVGQTVRFRVDAYPQSRFQGNVVQIRNSPRMMSNVVTYDTIIEVDNADHKLKPGMTAEVWIVVAERPNVLRVPNAALRTRLPESLRPPAPEDADASTRNVYRMRQTDTGEHLETIAITPGISDGVYTEVLSGMSEGDVLVTGIAVVTNARQERRAISLLGGSQAQF